MKKNLYIFTALLGLQTTFVSAQNVGIGTSTPNASAKLEITSTNSGLLIPRVALSMTTVAAPVAAPATSLLVYNTATAGDVTPGFYYWDGSKWVRIAAGLAPDHDIYEVGTSNAPDNINDNKYTYGTLAVGHNTALGHTLLVGGTTNATIKVGQLGGVNNIESGRLIFDESAQTYAPGSYCGMEFHYDGAQNRLFLNGACTAIGNVATFERTGNVGIGITAPLERLHVVGNIRASSLAGTGNRLVFSDANGTLLNLANGVNGQVLTISGGVATWGNVLAGNGLSIGTVAPVLNEVILGGTLEQTTTVDQAGFNLNWNLSSTGDFYINNPTGSLFLANNAVEAVVNESSQDYDFRVESDARTSALHVDAGSNVTRIGSGAGSLFSNGSTVAGVVVDYVLDIDRGTADGTAFGIGSVEYIVDLLSETTINNDFGPTADITYDMGWTYSWDDIYADDFWNVSDARLKTDIHDANYGLQHILRLRPVTYKWSKDYMGTTYIPLEQRETNIGFLAQEVMQVMPELVQTEDWKPESEDNPDHYVKKQRNYMAVNYVSMVPVLVKAMQEQQAQIEALQKEIEALKKN